MGREDLFQERDCLCVRARCGDARPSICQCISLSIKRIAFLLDHIKLLTGKTNTDFKFFTTCDRLAMAHPKNGLEIVNN